MGEAAGHILGDERCGHGVHRRLQTENGYAHGMRRADTGDLWWKNAVFYCADIETFYDSDGDGTGDIRGMTDRLEYLTDLGVTCLWLMPFYPTARKDDGYDITDFFGVDPRLGTLGDFVELRPDCPLERHPDHHRLRHEPHSNTYWFR